LENVSLDGRIILKLILNKQESLDWINLALGGKKWRAVVNMIMKFRVPYKAGIV
jgi:hypothetical protein